MLHPLFDEEPPTIYTQGGFHPVLIGDALSSGRYTILRKLGWGAYSSVWLAKDEREQCYVALKIVMSMYAQGRDISTPELEILLKIRGANPAHPGRRHVVTLLDHFSHTGPNGVHDCMVFELLGQTLEAAKLQQEREHGAERLPIPVVKQVARQLMLGLDYLHTDCGVIHTDLKPGNILIDVEDLESVVKRELADHTSEVVDAAGLASWLPTVTRYKSQPLPLPKIIDTSTIEIKIADFGTSNWVDRHFIEVIQPLALRAPEVVLGAPWGTSADIWNVACLIYELVTGKQLFGPWPDIEGYPVEDVLLCQMMGLLGPFSKDVLAAGKRSSDFFDENGKLHKIDDFVPCTMDELLREAMPPETSAGEIRELDSFLAQMLKLRPVDRSTASELLKHSWVRNE